MLSTFLLLIAVITLIKATHNNHDKMIEGAQTDDDFPYVFLLILCPTDNSQKRLAIRHSWFNISSYIPKNVVDMRFLSDIATQDDINAKDTIVTHADDFIHDSKKQGYMEKIFPKMRTAFRYSVRRRYSYILWLDDDTVPNIVEFLAIAVNYHLNNPLNVSRGVYMGVHIKNMADNPGWNPDYARYTSLHSYPIYAHGSAILFGGGIFPALYYMDQYVGLRFYGNGDTTFGIWLVGMTYDVQWLPSDSYVIDADPVRMNATIDQHNLPELCRRLYYHNLKRVHEIVYYGKIINNHCAMVNWKSNKNNLQSVLQYIINANSGHNISSGSSSSTSNYNNHHRIV